MQPIGKRRWAIAEGFIPADSTSQDPKLISHETACLLNAGDTIARVRIMVFFKDREPAGPYKLNVPARRTLHLRFNDLDDPEQISRDMDYASVIESDVPIVVQYTRLDSRKAELGLMSSIAFSSD